MHVVNIHERDFAADPDAVGALIDTLASERDALWPVGTWPPMKFDRPLGLDAAGGHGPIRYFVEAYAPGQSIQFRFTGPNGFDGFHALEVIGAGPSGATLRHTLDMTARGPANITWPLIFRPLHDALIEDSFARAQAALGEPPTVRPWPVWVKLLRWTMSRGKARPQAMPTARTGG